MYDMDELYAFSEEMRGHNADVSRLCDILLAGHKGPVTATGIERKYRTTSSIDDKAITEIAEFYLVEKSEVEAIFKEMVGWCMAKGRPYVNYYAALQNWVRREIDRQHIRPKRQATDEYWEYA